MPELPYFGKYLCSCGCRSSSTTHFELHNLKHLVGDLQEVIQSLMAQTKEEDILLTEKTKNLQKEMLHIVHGFYKICVDPPKDIMSMCHHEIPIIESENP